MLILEIRLADLVYMTSVLSVCPSYALFVEYFCASVTAPLTGLAFTLQRFFAWTKEHL